VEWIEPAQEDKNSGCLSA